MSTGATSLSPSMASGSVASPVTGERQRRDSIHSISVAAVADKEQLAEALDKIHNSARGCETLTTFKDFAPPPAPAPPLDSKANAGDLVQQGFSGLYSRFREAVGVGTGVRPIREEGQSTPEKRRALSPEVTRVSKPSVSSISQEDTSLTQPSTMYTQTTPMTELTASQANAETASIHQSTQAAKAESLNLMSSAKANASARQGQPTKATSSIAADPTIAPPRLNRNASRSTILTEHSAGHLSDKKSSSKYDLPPRLSIPSSSTTETGLESSESLSHPQSSRRDDAPNSMEGSIDGNASPPSRRTPSQSSLQAGYAPSPSSAHVVLPPTNTNLKSTTGEQTSGTRSPAFSNSRHSTKSSTDVPTSPVTIQSAGLPQHDYFSRANPSKASPANVRIPGTVTSSGNASDQLERMRRQILSKEFWMKDDTVKECFMCQTPFSAFRRKHHCRTCGCIFDSKCTNVISGDKFGVPGSLRVCKRCLEVITRRMDDAASDDSGDDHSFMPRFFGGNRHSPSTASQTRPNEGELALGTSEGSEDPRPISTPMMTIPATRRLKDANRPSAVLEFGAPSLSRPGSSRSLRSLNTGRPPSSAGHKRHHSKHGLLAGRYKPPLEGRAPFRKVAEEETSKRPKLPAFHDDNIIDPDLADYMSDGSSGDEDSSLFATLGPPEKISGSLENDRATFGNYVSTSRRHRRGEASIGGMSYLGRGFGEDNQSPASMVSHRKPARRRNMSNVSGSVHHLPSPRPRSAVFQKAPGASSDMLFNMDNPSQSGGFSILDETRHRKPTEKIELNEQSLDHIDKLLFQLLSDSGIPNIQSWQKVLAAILIQATDDVSPDVKKGESMDIRHYVKLKRIPGGKVSDSSYVSGVVFTKNLALKSMARKVVNPRVLLITFPLEYQRHHQHFMSLQPVIEQEKEFLRVVVQRITHLRPQVLLAEKSISGVALQLLSEANISVAYNVKHTVIEAVARCAETSIISSVDMLALPIRVGRCDSFEVRTFVNNDHPGRKKSYIFLSGCQPDLGCTISLRGADARTLGKIKHITELMAFVVYNLKLESSLLRDERIEPLSIEPLPVPASKNVEREKSPSLPGESKVKDSESLSVSSMPDADTTTAAENTPMDPGVGEANDIGATKEAGAISTKRTELISLHNEHAHLSQDNQVPDDVPMPTFYSDLVAIYDTKILSASPYVKFTMPYPLMKAREQERRLEYLRRLRDQDVVVLEREDAEKSSRAKFQLITPEMVEEMGQRAPRKVMEVLHAVHDAEYDKAMFNYHNQIRQWETYVHGNVDLLDPWSHQNIVVLFSMVCTETKIPCIEPELVGMEFYDEQHVPSGMDPDCSLGHYILDLLHSKDDICTANGCERPLLQHHRSYVHDRSRVTVFVENAPSQPPSASDLDDHITMWTYCKVCKKDSEETPMSDATFKYSFGKYLELLFWSRGLRRRHGDDCSHDHRRDHIRYFGLNGCRVRIHWDPVELLEIVVPRARITWKVANDLKLKNEIYSKAEERWVKFIASVKARLKSIRVDSVLPEKASSCQAQLDALKQRVQTEQIAMMRKLQDTYVQCKYYAIVPFNKVIREMLVKGGEWDQTFAKFEADFLGDKDMRQLTMMQLRKMFTDNDSKESLASTDETGSSGETEERVSQTFTEAEEKSTQPTDYTNPSIEPSLHSPGAEKRDPDMASEPVDAVLHSAEDQESVTTTQADAESVNKSVDLPSDVSGITDGDGGRVPISETPPNVSRIPVSTSTPGQTLSEKIEQKRREQALESSVLDPSENLAASINDDKAATRSATRKSGPQTATAAVRLTPMPTNTPQRPPPVGNKSSFGQETKAGAADAPSVASSMSLGRPDKTLSDRIGLNAFKNRNKDKQSGIPRLAKKRDTKVSTLARHFEQLSREFEKERIRDRKARAANTRQSRAILPRSKTKATVDVYDNVNEAFEEPTPVVEGVAEKSSVELEPADKESKSSAEKVEETPAGEKSQTSVDEVNVPTSLENTDDEDARSDTDALVPEELLPDIQDLADSIPANEIPDELPKHQKTSLMKYLTNFWAERSASGWPPLEYPLNPTDHIFADSDIIVREDEPSSVIAMALNSEHYNQKLCDIRSDTSQSSDPEKRVRGDDQERAKHAQNEDESAPENAIEPETVQPNMAVHEAPSPRETRKTLEPSLLRPTGTHLRYQFRDGNAVMTCKIFYAEQFDALRRTCHANGRIVESLSRCLKWDSRGGKTKSVFLKTLDDRFVLKSLSPVETSAFLRFAPGYFTIMAEALFHDLPSVIAKMLGFFQVFIKNPVTGTDIKLDLLVTENLFYDRIPSRIFDLKGSMRNRKIQSTGEQNEVLLDENMVEYIYESPLFAREHSKRLLRASVWNDTLFLERQNVMDYSLMIAVDEARKELVVGIIDCIRTYTWDKKLESWIKDRGFAGGGRNRPTVTSPKEYKSRFREAMARYILQAPNCWHMFHAAQITQPQYGRLRYED